MPIINIQGKNLFYDLINKEYLNSINPILIFLHEGLGCSEQWRDIPKKISETLKLPALVYDRYGYGKSEEIIEERETTFLEYEAKFTLHELFTKLNLQNLKKVLIGHSDGGTIALIYASLYPAHIQGVITEAAHVFTEKITLEGLKETVQIYKNTDLKNKLAKYHGCKTDNMFYSWTNIWLTEEMKEWNIENLLKGITCQVLAIQGKDDNYGTPAQLKSIKKNVSGNCNLLLIQECGHIPHHQARSIVENEIISFIKKINN